jgi:hypothetical protein
MINFSLRKWLLIISLIIPTISFSQRSFSYYSLSKESRRELRIRETVDYEVDCHYEAFKYSPRIDPNFFPITIKEISQQFSLKVFNKGIEVKESDLPLIIDKPEDLYYTIEWFSNSSFGGNLKMEIRSKRNKKINYYFSSLKYLMVFSTEMILNEISNGQIINLKWDLNCLKLPIITIQPFGGHTQIEVSKYNPLSQQTEIVFNKTYYQYQSPWINLLDFGEGLFFIDFSTGDFSRLFKIDFQRNN